MAATITSSIEMAEPVIIRRRARTLTDIMPSYVSESGLCSSTEVETSRGSIRIQHRTTAPGALGGEEGKPLFPRLAECAHFHYENVDFPPIQLSICDDVEEQSRSSPGTTEQQQPSLFLKVSCQGKSWIVKRTYENFRMLDHQLHCCVYDREYSQFREPPSDNKLQLDESVRLVIGEYMSRLSTLWSNLLTCSTVLNWFEVDNHGNHLIGIQNNDINTPAVAAAYATHGYDAKANDELTFEVGDMISIIDMPEPEEGLWWRGKRGFEVGSFPRDYVEVIGEKIPQKLDLMHPPSAGPSKPVLKKNGKLVSFFRSFILSRPSRKTLKRSGILKERVYGCDLGEHLENSRHDVPTVLRCCAEFIEKHGIVNGIYRLSGVSSTIQKLRNTFDEDRVPTMYENGEVCQDVHSVSSVLKMYFRELPNPLCTYHLYNKFVEAVYSAEDMRLLRVRAVVQQLPPPHYRTLEYLMRHLSRVCGQSKDTGMTATNMSIVWAPNLLRCQDLEGGGVAALRVVSNQTVVVEYLVCNAHLVFNPQMHDFPHGGVIPMQVPVKCDRPQSLPLTASSSKLMSLEEARNRAILANRNSRLDQRQYIDVGGGPATLPQDFHTVLDLPGRKRTSVKGSKHNVSSSTGWKAIFNRKTDNKPVMRKSDIIIVSQDTLDGSSLKSLHQHHGFKPTLRPVKSAESLVSAPLSIAPPITKGLCTPSDRGPRNSVVPCVLTNGPTPTQEQQAICPPMPFRDTSKLSPRCHNRSVSHDSYFRTDGSSADNSIWSDSTNTLSDFFAEVSPRETDSNSSSQILSYMDMKDMKLTTDLEDNEMKILSEDETLAGSGSYRDNSPPKKSHHGHHRKHSVTFGNTVYFPRSPDSGKRNIEDGSSHQQSPKKKKTSPHMSPSNGRKRTRIEGHLTSNEDMLFIDEPSPISSEEEGNQPTNPMQDNNKVTKRIQEEDKPVSKGWRMSMVTDSSPEIDDANNDMAVKTVRVEIHSAPLRKKSPSQINKKKDRRSQLLSSSCDDDYVPVTVNDSWEDPEEAVEKLWLASSSTQSPSEVSSVSIAAATASENESFVLPSSCDTSASSEGTTPDNSFRDYTPLVSDTEPGTPDMMGSMYENVEYENKSKYENVVPWRECAIVTYENVSDVPFVLSSNSAGEAVYEDVKVFRRSVQEVNSLLTSEKHLHLTLNSVISEQALIRSPDDHPSSTEPTTSSDDTGTTVIREPFSPKSPLSPYLDDPKRRFESEIGRDMLRERKMRLELERAREGSSSDGTNTPGSSRSVPTTPVSGDFDRLPKAPIPTPRRRTLCLTPSKSPDITTPSSPIIHNTPTSSDITTPTSSCIFTPTSPDIVIPSPVTDIMNPSISSDIFADMMNSSLRHDDILDIVDSSPDVLNQDDDISISFSDLVIPSSDIMQIESSNPDIQNLNVLEPIIIDPTINSDIITADILINPDDSVIKQSDKENVQTDTQKPHNDIIKFSTEPAYLIKPSESRNLSNRKTSVKELLSKFEKDKASNEQIQKTSRSPPCTASVLSQSFTAGFEINDDQYRSINGADQADKSPPLLRYSTSPDIRAAIVEDKLSPASSPNSPNERSRTKSESELSSSTGDELQNENKPIVASIIEGIVNVNDPSTRERIEKYKEERRTFLREKYRSESFRNNEQDDIIIRLRQKAASPTRPNSAGPTGRNSVPSSPDKKCDTSDDDRNDDVNVRERVATWSTSANIKTAFQTHKSSPSDTQKKVWNKPPISKPANGSITSPKHSPITTTEWKKSPPVTVVEVTTRISTGNESQTTTTSIRRIKDMAALFETKDTSTPLHH